MGAPMTTLGNDMNAHIIDTPLGPMALNVYDDGAVWLTHPDTSVRVGVGRLENNECQPYVHISTEDAAPEIAGEPWLHVALNDADLYDVEKSGPTDNSLIHKVNS